MNAMPTSLFTPESFSTFGSLLKYLRRRERLTQLELSIAVGYSETQITRLEKNQRLPDLTTVRALFVPALHIEDEPQIITRLLDLAESARQEDAPAPGLPPYKGLLYFDESDSDRFFGRETLTAHLAERVTNVASDASSRFLAVVGASGSGKSSLVRAGLAATLRRTGWDVRVFTPTVHPMKMLEAQLKSNRAKENSRSVLLLVDQFEETFTLCHDESERIAFVDHLLQLAREPNEKFFILIALRADFYSHCAQYPQLRHAVAAEQEYIGQMTTAELRRAIEEPAKHGGWAFEPGLVDLLLQDIGAHDTRQPEPGALPLLSHALLATWERRRGHIFTLEGYHTAGGVRSAIAETAESVFTDQLNQTQQTLAHEVFLRLTELGEGTEDTRRRAALNELVRQSEEAIPLRTVLNILAEARLITLNEDSAEVAHEALIREWQRLRQWLTQDREGLRLHRHLTESAREWEARGHDVGELYRGVRLAQTREWTQSNMERLNTVERGFLLASVEQEEHDATEREAQRQRELQSARKLVDAQKQATGRMRRVSLILLASLVIAVILAGSAFRLNRLATSRELASASINNLSVDPELSILLAREALSKSYTREAEEALHQAVMASHAIRRIHLDDELFTVASSPDGMRFAAAGQNGIVTILDADTGVVILKITAHAQGITQVAFSPSGKEIATASDDQTAKIWDAETGALIVTLMGHTEQVSGLAFNPDGTRLATVSLDRTLRMWDVENGSLIFVGPERTNDRVQMTEVAFSPDGSRLATGSIESVIEVWDANSNEPVNGFLFNEDFLPILALSFSPDGKSLAGGSGHDVRLWDLETNEVILNFTEHTNNVFDLKFVDRSVASAGLDRKIYVWDMETGEVLTTLAGHQGAVHAIAFRPNNTQLASVSSDGDILISDIGAAHEVYAIETPDAFGRITVSADGRWMAEGVGLDAKIWNIATGAEQFSLHHELLVNAVAFSPDGSHLATTDAEGNIQVWDLTTQTRDLKMKAGSTYLGAVAFSSDGAKIISAGEDNLVRVWDAQNGNLLFTLQGHAYPITSLAYSPDGKWFVSGGVDNIAIVWDAANGDKLTTLHGHTDVVWGVNVSPDGKQIVTASRDSTVKVWDVESGDELLTLSGHTGTAVSAVFNSDGSEIASASMDGLTNIWDAETGELQLTLHGNGSGVQGVEFAPDGGFVITVSDALRVYSLNISDLVSLADGRLTRSWTLEECWKYLHTATCPQAINLR